METLYLIIVLLVGYYISKRVIESSNRKWINSEIQKIKSIDLNTLNQDELEYLRKRTEGVYKKSKQLKSVGYLQNELNHISEGVSNSLINYKDFNTLKNYYKEIEVRKENNLDYSDFEKLVEVYKSKLKNKYFILISIEESTSKLLYDNKIISENEYKISLKEIEKRETEKFKKRVEWLIQELKPI